MADAAAGWYRDPALDGRERWWNGGNWTEKVRLRAAAFACPFPVEGRPSVATIPVATVPVATVPVTTAAGAAASSDVAHEADGFAARSLTQRERVGLVSVTAALASLTIAGSVLIATGP